jgi:hypothetical protein
MLKMLKLIFDSSSNVLLLIRRAALDEGRGAIAGEYVVPQVNLKQQLWLNIRK